MKSIEKLEYYFEKEVPLHVARLLPEAQPLWGTMNATKMLDHLNDPFKLCTGVYPFPEGSIMEKADKLKVIALLSDRPLVKNFNNPLIQMLSKSSDLEHEQAKVDLIKGYQLFKEYYKSKGNAYTMPHNVFGYLNYHEWLWFHYKHFSHHFAQFGLIPYIDRFELE
ncbi:MAG: DUF1569 domain-containing protein [Bacteroidota bacterium]